ncbi:MAG: hypothetical protein WDO74_28135 [Pseudomonadota bacterium]
MLNTQNFLVRYMSRKEAHSGFSDQAMPTLPVANAISVSECPRSLNIVPATQITREKGMPMATYKLGTQVIGLLTRRAFSVMPSAYSERRQKPSSVVIAEQLMRARTRTFAQRRGFPAQSASSAESGKTLDNASHGRRAALKAISRVNVV